MKHHFLVLAALASMAITGWPAPGYAASASSSYGTLVEPSVFSDRTITITESTRYVNVVKFDTVRFVTRGADGRESSFVWRFDTFGTPNFPFSDIAPAGFSGGQPIRVYVDPKPAPW